MDDIARYRKAVYLRLLYLGLPIALLLFWLKKFAVAESFIFGCLTSAVNFYFLSVDIGKLNTERMASGVRFLIMRYFLRYAVLVLLFCIVFIYKFNVIAFVIGFFTCQLLMFTTALRTEKNNEKEDHLGERNSISDT
ncbi:MAG: ATP synthase subunit I [Candidatus Omnitrophica bacterium]|nr:ATP synthase subunit I [Candidatus Omnitrophota bacterium]